MFGTDFGTSVLNTYSILESKILGAGLTNNPLSEDIRELHVKFTNSLIEYLNTNNKESRAFLVLCTNNIQNISENNFDFLKANHKELGNS